MKLITIPRLELVAATLAAKLSFMLRRELDIQLDCVYLWTDGVVVLRYICNTFTQFEMFAANNIELLHTLSSMSNGYMCRAQIIWPIWLQVVDRLVS